MDAITELIKNLINKEIHKSTLISSVPCRVIESLGNEMYTVQLITDNSQYTLPNMSGSSLSVGENVRLFYYGEYISSKSSYIGASLNKDSGGSAKYIISTNATGEIGSGAKQISYLLLKALNDTTVSLSFNANILGSGSDNFILSVSVDGVDYDYQIKGTAVANKYVPCNFTLPLAFDIGDHAVVISISGTGSVTDINAFICGHGIDDADIIIKEMTGTAPLTFSTTGSSLLDWQINGASGGVGKVGKNYLKQREITVSNGAVGTFLDSVFHAWIDPFEGRTFNSGEATKIYFTIRRSDDSSIDAANVGDFMLVEGTAIPTAYDADTNLYKKPILQGSSVYHTSEGETGVSQVIYTNEDEYGRNVMYGQGSEATAMRCKTYSIKLKPNTDYSIRIFNSSYSNLQIGGTFMTEPGTVEQYFPNDTYMGGGIVNLPSCEQFVASNEQWTRLSASHSIIDHNTAFPIDVRPYKFEFCESVADLEAGTYKLMIDILGNHHMVHGATTSMVGFAPYVGCYLDVEWDYAGRPQTPSNKFEHFALIGEDDSLIIPETQVFNSSTVRYKDVGDTPYPNFFHQEYTFTVPRKMKVGVLHRAYSRWNYYGGDGDESPWFRFMICDTDVEAEEFETSGLLYNIAGESAWEKYHCTLPITISSDTKIQAIDIDLGDSLLEEGQSISLSDTQIPIPTYIGNNTISIDSTIQPVVYIKYRDWAK